MILNNPSSSKARISRSITFCAAAAVSSAMVFAQSTPQPSPKSPDTEFLEKAAFGGYAEVQLGQLAAKKGTAEEIKKFGHRMIHDHTALNAELKPFIEQAGIAPPTQLDKKDQDEYDKLNALSGDNFDREYISFMVKDHHADLREFRKEESTTTDAPLKAAVAKGETVIAQHTSMAVKLNKQLGGPVDDASL